MLLNFSVENFLSIKERQTLSLEATKDNLLESSHVLVSDKIRVLRSAAIYGPNASGKSNLLAALARMRFFVETSAKETQDNERTPAEPFLLNEETATAPTLFEVEFLWQNYRYRYGFLCDASKIHQEWLFRRRGRAKEAKLFTRNEQQIDTNVEHFKEGHERKQFARPNALFLSVCAQLNGPVAAEVLAWFGRMRNISGIADNGVFFYTARQLQNPEKQKQYEDFVRRAQPNIVGLRSEIIEVSPAAAPSQMAEGRPAKKKMRAEIKTAHQIFDNNGKVSGEIEFDLKDRGSAGSIKFIAMTGPLFHVIEEGSILVIDEFEARLHPLLTRAIVEWFHNSANRSTAQLIIATHDVGLMEPEILRRDQVWFCEMNHCGATSLYSLAEFDANTVRPNTRFNKQYLLGIFGAIPKLALTREDASG